MPYPNQHSARVRDPQGFEPDSMRTKQLGAGVSLILGKLRDGDGNLKAASYRFDKEKFDAKQARAWLKAHGVSAYTLELAQDEHSESSAAEDFAEIRDLEIFAVGTHRGQEYTKKDLDQIIANSRRADIDPPLVVGHGEDQALLSADDLPAAGWLTGLRRVGGKLLASFGDVPRVVAEAIRSRAYGKRSVELYPDYQGLGLTLRRVALLGGQIPQVKSLSDVVALYGDDEPDYECYEFAAAEQPVTVALPRSATEGEDTMPQNANEQQPRTFTEEQMTTLIESATAKAVADATAKLSEAVTTLTKERDDLKAKAADAAQADAAHAAQLHQIEIDRFCEKLSAAGKLPPALLKQGVAKFAASLSHGDGDDVVKVSFGEADKAQELDQLGWFKKFLEALPKAVEFGEVATDATAPADDDKPKSDMPTSVTVDGTDVPVDSDSVALHEKAKKYAEEHKCSYGEALIEVSE